MAARTKLTYEDFLLIPNDGRRHELLDGEHFMTPSPNTKHQRLVGKLFKAVSDFLTRHPLGEVFVAPYDVVLSPFDVCEPDLVFVANDRASIITPANIQGVPSLVIEILSEGTRKLDETYKRVQYERFSVPEYWIVDPDLERVKEYRIREARYDDPSELRLENNDELTSEVLPGFRLPLSNLFEI